MRPTRRGRVDALVATIDEAAEHHHNEMTKWVLENLERLTEATGNVVDAFGPTNVRRHLRDVRDDRAELRG